MIQLVIGAAAGYVLGTKAGRRRFEQIRSGYETVINSPVTRKMVDTGRKALADRLDPEPRMREVRDLRADSRTPLGNGEELLEDDRIDFDEDKSISYDDRTATDSKGRPVRDQDGTGRPEASRGLFRRS